MAPKQFDDCVAGGGKVRTMPMKGNRYAHVCFMNGKSAMGEVMMRGQKKPATEKQGG